jgi:hypothetical protein
MMVVRTDRPPLLAYWRNQFKWRNELLKKMGFHTYADYLQSGWWESFRFVKKAVYPNCQACGSRGSLHIHHWSYLSVGHEIRCLHPCGDDYSDDGRRSGIIDEGGTIVICRQCHVLAHGWPLEQIKFLRMASQKNTRFRQVCRAHIHEIIAEVRDPRLFNLEHGGL